MAACIYFKCYKFRKQDVVSVFYPVSDFNNDKGVVLVAVKHKGLVLEYASDELKK